MMLNKAMQKLLDSIPVTNEFSLSLQLNSILDSEIHKLNNVYTITGQSSDGHSGIVDDTGYECSVNHIHIEDYLDNSSSENLFKNGIQYMTLLKKKLEHLFPSERFRLILSYNLDSQTYPSCTVRFHKIREHENWIDLENLENYKTEAILVTDTRL